ncbi:TetR/AcrR family transcriptional regulator [Parafrankia sp. EUN1f]|uniref:TetR/AcrR family transcriptional regulator n=1 Tax=Parafrankia sp. EUN1f TaxID=102897 RepID=UPI0001C46259|nr:TetR/AcrR family transcriptional regulator [Parafrankia sp. EUN1f]EFC86376.1 transcriptional regulator, TetR family [Parafrankia sp. EUN1f]
MADRTGQPVGSGGAPPAGRRDTRARMVVAAAELFRERGYDGTGCRDVVARAHAARGAIYHHFPGGKTQIGVDAARWAGDRVAQRIEAACADAAPVDAVRAVLDLAEQILIGGGGPAGCPVAAVALSAEDTDGTLRAVANNAFDRWRTAIAGCLTSDGVAAARAARFAAMTVAAVEGAVVLCRAAGGIEPYRDVRDGILDHLDHLLGTVTPNAAP